MFRIHVTDSINQIFDDEMVYITKTNPITKNKSAIGLSLTIELEF